MKRRYVFLCHSKPSNVIFSQVVEYIESFEEKGVSFELVFLLGGRSFIASIFGRLAGMKIIRTRLNNKVKCLPCPRLDRNAGVIWAASLLNIIYPTRKDELIIFHARNMTSACIATQLKINRPDIRYVYDVRGDKLSEYEFLGSRNGVPSETLAKKMSALLKHEKEAAQAADRVFCVSEILKDLIIKRTGLSCDYIDVFPCGANARIFHYHEPLRTLTRTRLNLEDKFVLVYSGGVTKWHCAEQIFAMVSALMQVSDDVYLVFLTPDTAQAMKMAEEELPADRYLVICSGHDEIPEYLMASDMGLLIREDDQLNRVASPTKFAEYMLCGLPVIISDGIGDYSNFVREGKHGVVLSDNNDMEQIKSKFLAFRKSLDISRSQRAELGCRYFSKDSYLDRRINTYLSL